MTDTAAQHQRSGVQDGNIAVIAGSLAALALLSIIPSYLPRLTELAIELTKPGIGPTLANSDFVNYWFAGRLAWRGEELILFDPQGYFQLLQSRFGEGYAPHIWSYPPHALFVFLPLGFTSYKAGMALFLTVTFILYAHAAYQFHRRYSQSRYLPIFVAAHIGFVATNLVSTQNGFLTGALLLYFLAYYDRRPVIAALCLAVLTIKPQLGILIPFMLAYTRSWNVIGLTVLFSLALIGASVLVFGFEPWREYWLNVLPVQSSVLSEWRGSFVMMMPTFFAAMRILDFNGDTALLGHVAFALLCLPIAVYSLTRAGNPLEISFVLMLATFCVTPYAFNYDMGALVTVAALFIVIEHGSKRSLAILSGVICLSPVWVFLLASASLPLTPVFLLATLLALGLLASENIRSSNASRPSAT